jgi:hypothetical protein
VRRTRPGGAMNTDLRVSVVRLGDGGCWTAETRGSPGLVLAAYMVSELQNQGLVDVVARSVLVPTELGREAFRACAAKGHVSHMSG